jgi:hypothetical protein
MTQGSLQVYAQGWLTDFEAAQASPGYPWVWTLFEQMVTRARLSGGVEDDIANALFNHLIQVTAALEPTDAQVHDLAKFFIEGVIKIRDRDPETRQD